MIVLHMSWPDRALSQNSRSHWSKRAKATAAARREAWAVAMGAGLHRHRFERPILRFTFHPPDRRKRDAHNMPAMLKATIDGIADAMQMDDALFLVVWPRSFADPAPDGRVTVQIEEAVPVAEVEFRGTIS